MSIPIVLEKACVSAGLPTLTLTIPSTGPYTVYGQYTANPTTSVSIVIKQNGTTKYTSPTPAAQQDHFEFKFPLNCTAADAIEIDVTSAAAIDKQLNTVQTIFTIGAGY